MNLISIIMEINKTEFSNALKKAQKHQTLLESACGDLAILFEPYFDGEISVFYQASDGFVILYDDESNEEVKHAFEMIKENPDYYRDKNHYSM